MDEKLVEQLKNMVSGGPVEFIFSAEQALSLIEACGNHEQFAADKNFGELFGTIQGMAINEFVLSVTKLYEKPGNRYPNVSVPSVLAFIEANVEALELLEPRLVQRGLEILKIDATAFNSASSQADRNRQLTLALRERLPEVDSSDPLRALKTLRDKKIAHPEDIGLEKIEKTTWEQAERLLEVPRAVVGIIGDAYLSTAYWDEKGSYLMSIDGSRVGRAMQRLVKAAGG